LVTLGLSNATASEIALTFGGTDMVEADTSLRKVPEKGTLDFSKPLSPETGYTGPEFFGSYGRSANGTVDNARILKSDGPYKQNMLDFNDSVAGVVDQMYGVVIFRPDSFEGRFKGESLSLATSEALAIRTYTGYVPDQVGWVHFYVEVGDDAYVSPPFSFTKDADGGWGETNITVDDPRKVRWTRAVFRDGTPFLAGDRPEEMPDFDAVTAVGFAFQTAGTDASGKNAFRFATDFFMVSAE
jgi:hypothetical protein